MESNNTNNSSTLTRLIPVFIIFIGLLGLYYLYQYLFGPSTNNTYPLITATQSALVDKPLIFTTTQMAPLYEGGEFTFSTWIYISSWSQRGGYNKSIFRIGGYSDDKSDGNEFDTMRIYLGARTPKLYVRFQTKEVGAVPTGVTSSDPDSLDKTSHNLVYNTIQTDSGLLDNSRMCDLAEIPMQRWVNITVAASGKTVDVYLDGKLSRSCVLPNPFKVDTNGYSGYALEHKGFGGQIANTTMYDSALNPEQVYKNYMAGPEPITSIGGLFGSFFAPNLKISVTAS